MILKSSYTHCVQKNMELPDSITSTVLGVHQEQFTKMSNCLGIIANLPRSLSDLYEPIAFLL